jgi:hypothetical protein
VGTLHPSWRLQNFFIMSLLYPSGKPQLRVSLGLLTIELLGRHSHCSDNNSMTVQQLGRTFNCSNASLNNSAPGYTGRKFAPNDQQQVGQLGQAQDVLLSGYKALGD